MAAGLRGSRFFSLPHTRRRHAKHKDFSTLPQPQEPRDSPRRARKQVTDPEAGAGPGSPARLASQEPSWGALRAPARTLISLTFPRAPRGQAGPVAGGKGQDGGGLSGAKAACERGNARFGLRATRELSPSLGIGCRRRKGRGQDAPLAKPSLGIGSSRRWGGASLALRL